MASASRLLRSIIIGAPGSGKGTIAARIVKDFAVKHLSSGDVLRSQISQKTDIGILAKSYINEGTLVPDEVMVGLIAAELEAIKRHSWLLDGFPRTVAQAEHLQKQQDVDVVISLNVPFETIVDRIKGRWVHVASGRVYHGEFNPPKVQIIVSSIQWSAHMLTSIPLYGMNNIFELTMNKGVDDVTGEPLIQRDDDKPETVRARLETFQKLTEPVQEFYRNMGVLQEFTGSYSNELWPHVHAGLTAHAEPLQYTHYS